MVSAWCNPQGVYNSWLNGWFTKSLPLQALPVALEAKIRRRSSFTVNTIKWITVVNNHCMKFDIHAVYIYIYIRTISAQQIKKVVPIKEQLKISQWNPMQQIKKNTLLHWYNSYTFTSARNNSSCIQCSCSLKSRSLGSCFLSCWRRRLSSLAMFFGFNSRGCCSSLRRFSIRTYRWKKPSG